MISHVKPNTKYVVCNNDMDSTIITKGNTYEVIKEPYKIGDSILIGIINDYGQKLEGMFAYRFTDVAFTEKEKLKDFK